MGDLVLTCTDNQSRNRRFGLALGQGQDSQQAQATIGQVVEGFSNAKAVCQLAKEKGVDMPIVAEVYAILYENKSPLDAVNALMARKPTVEY
jgi:glycerol-3-phosphate dehydrogenase (NAD(P)+)